MIFSHYLKYLQAILNSLCKLCPKVPYGIKQKDKPEILPFIPSLILKLDQYFIRNKMVLIIWRSVYIVKCSFPSNSFERVYKGVLSHYHLILFP